MSVLSAVIPFAHDPVLRHTPPGSLEHGLRQSVQALLARGIEPRISHDLRRLVALNAEKRASWALHVPPALDPDQGGFGPEEAFMLEGRDIWTGELVFTEGARLVVLDGTNLKESLESLTLFYRDPASQAEPGEWIRAAAAGAAEITGRVAFLGAVWIDPAWRSKGLSRIFATMTRWYVRALWQVDWTAAVVTSPLAAKGVPQNYGYESSEPGVTFHTRWSKAEWHLIAKSAAELDAHIAGGLEAYN